MIGNGLRLALLLENATRAGGSDVPGVIIMHADDTVESITPEAEEWLAQIPRDEGANFELPVVIHIAAWKARAVAAIRTKSALARIRLTSGRWLLVRASQLRNSGSGAERTAVILERARAAELAPIIVELYELSARERHDRIAATRAPDRRDRRGALDPRYTVRDYTKAIFAKLGVGSRPELTAKLFHDHYLSAIDYTI